MHPLVGDLSSLKDSDLETKINELTRKYFMTSNFHLQQQVAMTLESYKAELNNRRQAEWQRTMEMRNKDLDKLINVD